MSDDKVKRVIFGDNYTAEHLLRDVLDRAGDINELVIIYEDKDGYVIPCWNKGSVIYKLGLLKLGGEVLLDSLEYGTKKTS